MQTTPEMIRTVFSTENKCDHGFSREKQIKTKSIVIHPDFDEKPQSQSDIALIYLAEPIPPDYPTALLYDGKSPISDRRIEMLGYGITNELKQDSMQLRTTTKDYFKDLAIKKSLVIFNQKNNTGGFCRGDSGGPVYTYIGNTKKVLGINSFNISAPNEKNKQCQTAGVAMYIPYFAGWIKSEILKL
jgi:Trypsin